MNWPIARPVMRWQGGKFRLASWLLSFFPPHNIYVEPYSGAASVLMLKPRAQIECYNDLDGDVVAVFRVLRDPVSAQELRRRLALTAFAQSELDWSYEAPADPVDAAHRMIVRSFLGHGSDAATRACRAGFRSGITGNAALDWAAYPDQVPAFAQRLSGVVITNDPALDVIARMDTPQTLFYLDPPPLQTDDRDSHRARFGMTAEDYRQLAVVLRQVRGRVVLSCATADLGDDALPDWQRFDLQQRLDGGERRTESLWINPACSAALSVGPRPGRALFAEVA